jgi:hypothetical protein
MLACIVLQSLTTAHASQLPVSIGLPSVQDMCSPSTFILELVVNGYHQASWTAIPGSGNYNLTVVNLATNQIHCAVSTPNTSTIIAGLTTGSYMVSLSRGSSTVPPQTFNIP